MVLLWFSEYSTEVEPVLYLSSEIFRALTKRVWLLPKMAWGGWEERLRTEATESEILKGSLKSCQLLLPSQPLVNANGLSILSYL